METVRLGIVGLGNMGSVHAAQILDGKVPRCTLSAVCDCNAEKLAKYPTIKGFTDCAEMIRSGSIDAILVATPHYFHTTMGIDALENGLHVLVEKPISVHKADAEKLIAAHRAHPELVFAAMFNQRTDPHYITLKRMLERGDVGAIRRVNWIITDWFRTEAYYRSSDWRATWKGEGGGVLLNQCPHQLDLLQWLCGMPTAVTAIGGTGKFHDVEVEDDVTAILEYANGVTGVFVTTTGEAPGTNRLEIVGTRGKILVEKGDVSFVRNEIPMDEFSRTTDSSFGKPPVWNIEIPVGDSVGEQHIGIKKNFVNAILDGEPLIAPAEEGLHSVELANAMLLSVLTHQRVELPLDGAAYAAVLQRLIDESTFQKKETIVTQQDFSKSTRLQ